MMGADGTRVGDGSWNLNINVTDLEKEKTVRVSGDLHIGGVMLKLVEELDIAIDWSDHGLWWPDKNMWLTRTRFTLDQYGVQADANIWFSPMHKMVRVQLPDLQTMDLRVDFSVNVFNACIKICKELRIRHPEEVSLARKLDSRELKKNQGVSATRRQRPGGMHNQSNNHMTNNGLDTSIPGSPSRLSPYNPATPQGTLMRGGTPHSPYGTIGNSSPNSPYLFNANGVSPASMNSLAFEGASESLLLNSPQLSAREALHLLYRPKNYAEKARINAAWLDSSRSLMEQGIRENSIVLLRFKFYSFYDLNPKYDAVRINQIYEQARWALISEELDCTEEEMMMFGALQLQVQLQVSVDQPDLDMSGTMNGKDDMDEIDAALTDLQVSLEGSSLSSPGDITHIPELQDNLRFFKPKKFTLKNYKRYFFLFKDTHLTMYRSREESNEPPLMRVNLRGCEVAPDVNISAQKFNMKLFIPSQDSLTEVWVRAETEEQYAKWMAAFRLASKGKTMADSSYETEVKSILSFLSMQQPSNSANGPPLDPSQLSLQPENFVAPRYMKKLKSKQIAQRILDAHSNVKEMHLLEAKMNYIKAWQALPEYGISYFIIQNKSPNTKNTPSKKEELLGIAFNRLILMNLSSGDSIKTWRFQNMNTWSVNWEKKQVQVVFDDEELRFLCLTADCKIVHEFIGGYIFLSMRSSEKNQSLNQEMFHRLTGGWD